MSQPGTATGVVCTGEKFGGKGSAGLYPREYSSSVPFHVSGMTISYAAPLISPVQATESHPVKGTAVD